MQYAEMTYFDGAFFAHIAARDEHERLTTIDKQSRKAVEQLTRRRGFRAFGRRMPMPA